MNKWLVTLPTVLALSASQLLAADIERVPYPAGDVEEIVKLVRVDNLVFPSGIEGSSGDTLEQVDEIVQKAHDHLGELGLGIGNMLQHTIYLKDGAAAPIDVLNRFHAKATELAPSLKDKPSVGTIVRVPRFHGDNSQVAIDLVAGVPDRPGEPDDFERIRFTFGPQEIVETIAIGDLIFTAGMEAMDFQNRTLDPDLNNQIAYIVEKIDSALQKKGLSIGNMISHNLYVQEGTDPIAVINKFHEEARQRAPELGSKPSVGTLVIVNGMVSPGFKLEVDAVAAYPKENGDYERVPFTETQMDIVKSVTVDNLVFLAGMEGVDFNKGGAVSPNVLEQVEVAVLKVHEALKASGLSIGNMINHKLYLVQGAADPDAVLAKFHEVATRLAPELKQQPSSGSLYIVEGLAGPALKFEASVIAAKP